MSLGRDSHNVALHEESKKGINHFPILVKKKKFPYSLLWYAIVKAVNQGWSKGAKHKLKRKTATAVNGGRD